MRARGRGGGETERQRLRTMFASPITAVPPIDDTQKVANWETVADLQCRWGEGTEGLRQLQKIGIGRFFFFFFLRVTIFILADATFKPGSTYKYLKLEFQRPNFFTTFSKSFKTM